MSLGLEYCELCDDLVDLVQVLSLSMDIVSQGIFWKTSKED